ncbi:MAG: tetratricopeptide repeat protein [Rhodospirillales bacterium]
MWVIQDTNVRRMNRQQRRAAKKHSKGPGLPAAGTVTKPDALFARGVEHHQAGRLDRAEAAYRDLLALESGHAEGWYHLGGIAYQKADWPRAAECLQKALSLKPDYVEALNVLGVSYKNLGRLPEALECLQGAVALRPGLADARCNLGNVFLQLGRLEDAEKQYRDALDLNPGFVLAHSNLGAALLKQHRWDDAVGCLKKAIALAPSHAEAHNNLGVAYKEQDRTDQAIAQYRKALEFSPDFADAHNNLGNALVAAKQTDAAIEHYRRALALGLNNAEILTNLGAALQEKDRLDDAAQCYRRAIDLAPDYPVAYNNMGNVLNLQGRPDDAIAFYRKAVGIDPTYADAHNNIGVVMSEQGRLKEAIETFKNTISADPDHARVYRNIGTLHKYGENDAFAAALLDKAKDLETLSPENQVHLRYALGKYYQDIGSYDDAFGHFKAGASLKRGMLTYDPATIENALHGVAHFFDPGALSGIPAYGAPDDAPIFILGMPRSGTTLVEQILAAHPQVHAAGELKDFDAAFGGFRVNKNVFTATSPEAANLAARGQAYADGLRRRDPNVRRVTDKMPFNFMNVGLIHLALPNATVIHCRRDPVDTCLSCFLTYFAEPIDWSYDLEETGRFYAAYAKMMDHWHAALPGRLLDVQYEDVVADLETQARRIVEQCGLPWDDACLDFQNARRAVRTASAGQVRKPIYRSSVQRWRRYEPHLGPLLRALAPVLETSKAA